jgi:hypothetical protein
MPIVDLFSTRQSESQQPDDVWVYDRIPKILPVQVPNIVKGALGTAFDRYDSDAIYLFVRDAVAA